MHADAARSPSPDRAPPRSPPRSAGPAIALARGLPAMTDGPFYPSLAYRARSLDWDADLTTVRGRAPTASRCRARAASTSTCTASFATATAAPSTAPRSRSGNAMRSAAIAIRAAPAIASTPASRASARRAATAAAATASARSGRCRIPGRTPHIHVKLRHPAFGEVTSQLFVVGEPGNAGRFSLSQPRRGRSPGSRDAPAASARRRRR